MQPAPNTASRPSGTMPRQGFAHSHAAVGGGAHVSTPRPGMHYIRLLLAAAPLIIGELVTDNQKRWRYIRLCSLVGVALTEGMHQRGNGKWQDRVGGEQDIGRER